MPKTMFRFGITSFAELRVEYDGLLLPQHEGKMHAEDLQNYLARFFADDTWQHMATPKMVYLSYPTEYGTLYSRSELEAIHRISRHAIDMAMQLQQLFSEKQIPLYIQSPTNQQFPILTPEQMQRLEGKVLYEIWDRLPDGRAITRFATSWATPPEHIRLLKEIL